MRIVVTETIDPIRPHLEEIIRDLRRGFRHNIFTIDQINTWHSSNTRGKKIRVKWAQYMSYLQKFCDSLTREILNIFFVCDTTTNLVMLTVYCAFRMVCFVTYVLL